MNGDAYDDVIVGAWLINNGESQEGRAYVYYGFCDGGDADGDGRCAGNPTFDCADLDANVWATPGEVQGLLFTDKTTLSWTEPSELGGTAAVYDTIRSDDPANFLGATCVESNDGADTMATDNAVPLSGAVYNYLNRAENDCPSGEGSLGTNSDGVERAGMSCP